MNLSREQEELIKELEINYSWSREQIFLGLRAGFKCEYCGKDFLKSIEDYDSWQIDHIVPQSSLKPYQKESFQNKAVSCKLCNFAKGSWDGLSVTPDLDRTRTLMEVKAYITIKLDEKRLRLQTMNEVIGRLRK